MAAVAVTAAPPGEQHQQQQEAATAARAGFTVVEDALLEAQDEVGVKGRGCCRGG